MNANNNEIEEKVTLPDISVIIGESIERPLLVEAFYNIQPAHCG
ncbi:hypothetical protein [Paenibacillus prosopidis]|nr:hypothetical protein [Paenibacillus prosopidis]